jgi:hypothetical protein
VASIPDPPGHGGEIAGPEGSGEYEVGAAIREGWGGTLRTGRYLRSGRLVTVQDIRADLAATSGLIDRLGQIGRQAAELRDPHLLAVYDLVDDGGVFRLVAEWSDGSSLAATLTRGSLPAERAVAVVDGVLAGLAALHGGGLFHGRVGPETVVIEADGRARLAELAICAAAAAGGAGPKTDVRDAARLGLHLLRGAGSRLDAVRRPLDAAAAAAGARDTARLREELASAAAAVLGAGWRERQIVAPARVKRRRGMVLAVLAVAVVAAAAVAAVVLLVGGHSAPVSPGPLVVSNNATLDVNPQTGGCNTTFSFVARGSLSGVGTLVYRWEQSDGQVTADTSVPIGSTEGAFQFVEAWRLQGSQSVSGSMTLHILKPVDRKISRPFRYSCP